MMSSTDEVDARLKEATDALETLLQRYRDLCHLETPEWEPERERPVKDAKNVLNGDYRDVIADEFTLLRNLSRKMEVVVAHLDKLQKAGSLSEILDIIQGLVDMKDDLEDMLNQHIGMKKEQDIIRLDPDEIDG